MSDSSNSPRSNSSRRRSVFVDDEGSRGFVFIDENGSRTSGGSSPETVASPPIGSPRKFLWDDDLAESPPSQTQRVSPVAAPPLDVYLEYDHDEIDLEDATKKENQTKSPKDSKSLPTVKKNDVDVEDQLVLTTQMKRSLVPSVFQAKRSGFAGDGYDGFGEPVKRQSVTRYNHEYGKVEKRSAWRNFCSFVGEVWCPNADERTSPQKRASYLRECTFLAIGIALIAAVILAVTHSAFLAGINGTEQMNQDRFDALKLKLIESGAASTMALETEDSPQSNALHWLSNQDPSKIDVDDKSMTQRFALAVVFFSTSGKPAFGKGVVPLSDWLYQDNWMTGKGFCSWYGVKCVGDNMEDTDVNGDVHALNLPSNQLMGSIEPEIALFTKMDMLDLSSNIMYGDIPLEIGLLQNIRVLSLHENDLSGTVPEEFGELSNLQYLSLGSNELSGEIPNLLKLENLETLFLTDNELTGSIPDTLYSLTSLTELRLGDNQLSGTVSDQLSNFDNLGVLDLQDNKFSGTLPDEFERFTNLTEVFLNNNEFTGTLPQTIGKLSHLERLFLHKNRISGEVSAEIGGLTAIYDLFLNDNALEGTVPDIFDKLTGLETLRLSGNSFSGSIPNSLTTCKYLREVLLEGNAFEGEIPAGFGKLQWLERLSFENNQITGIVSSDVCDLTTKGTLEHLSADCEKNLTCMCCTFCY